MTSVADYYLAKIRADLNAKPEPKPKPTKPVARNKHKAERPTGNETWAEIPGYENYWISDTGKVLSKTVDSEGKLLKTLIITRYGFPYARVGLYDKRNQFVHLLVAKAFCKGRNPGDVVWHKDRDTLNNNANNLEWISRAESRQRRKKD